MDKMERIVKVEKVTNEPVLPVDDVDPVPVDDVVPVPVVDGDGAEVQAAEKYPGAIPVGIQTPTVVLTLTGVVVFPVHPGPM
jgi:hypothetical protein